MKRIGLSFLAIFLYQSLLYAQDDYEEIKNRFNELQANSTPGSKGASLSASENVYKDYGEIKGKAEHALERFTQDMDEAKAAEMRNIIKVSIREQTNLALNMTRLQGEAKKAPSESQREALPSPDDFIRMTKGQVTEIMGEPDRINKSMSLGGSYEQWCYDARTNANDTFIYFGDDETVIRYQQ